MSSQAPQLLLDILPATEPTLDNFIVGGNREAVAALCSLGPGRAVYLWGPAGSGRSHLLAAAVRARPGAVLCTPSSSQADWLAATEGCAPLVAIDDVGLLDDARQATVFRIYNRWRESAAAAYSGFALAVAGDSAPLHMPLREDLRTRLGWDLVFRLEPLSDADKLAALRAHAAARALEITPDLLEWLLTRQARDLRQLITLLDELDRYSLATKRPITLPLLKTMLASDSRPPAV